ncbi:MAG: hypothetical protein IPP29_17255 [Bacteroidetes bacterium]|nr:hypothetical protein [Bacteroidota bacterium]
MKKVMYLVLFTFICETSMAQIEWRLLGNTTVTATDFVGSVNTQNLNFRTFNNPRLRILTGGLTGNGATTDGFIGIGDFNFFAPLNLLHQHINYNRSNFHQFTNLNTGL